MIDQEQVENIRRYGAFKDSGESRLKILRDDIGFRMDQKAEYVIIGGCIQPEMMPEVLGSFKNLLENLKINYTMLSKEYCCGWMPIGQMAVMAKNEEDIGKYKELSKGFILENFRQAETLGAKSIVLFCSACEPNYSNHKNATPLEIISYTELLDRALEKGRLNAEIDYYPGCYRFRRRITAEPLDIKSAERLLGKIDGLKINKIDTALCCYKQADLEKIVGTLKTKSLMAVCTGCYHNLKAKLQSEGDYQVKMLPEVLLESLRSKA
jgi:Fe-S oxidoreductase